MCLNCVAGSLPYVGIAVGGLRVMGARARSARSVAPAAAEAPAEAGDAATEQDQPISG